MSLQFDISARLGDFRLTVSGENSSGVTALFGQSGSGKTTLLNCLAGVIKPDRGVIVVDDTVLFSAKKGIFLTPENRRIGYVFQESNLFPHLTGLKNILYGYDLLSSDERVIHPPQVLSLLEIEHVMDRQPSRMSGGERSRVTIARALLTSPRILFLDEPLVSVDSKLKGKILPYIDRINRDLHIPVLYVSHDISEVLYIADEVFVLQEGKLIGKGDPRSILMDESIISLTTSSSIENLFDAVVTSADHETGLIQAESKGQSFKFWSKEVPDGKKVHVTLGLKASDIVLSATPPGAVSVRNVLQGMVENIQLTDGRAMVHVDIGLKLIAEVTRPAVEELGLKPGKQTYILFKARSIRLVGAQPE